MKNIASIPTEYSGVRFRSRLEAKWALFFDLIDMKWEYEPNQYHLGDNGDIWYTPDFWLKENGYFAEAKPVEFSGYEKYKCALLAEETNRPCLLLSGSPNFQPYTLISGIKEQGKETYTPNVSRVVLTYPDNNIPKSPSEYGPKYVDAILKCRATKFETKSEARCVALTAQGERCNCKFVSKHMLCTNHAGRLWREIKKMEREKLISRESWCLATVGMDTKIGWLTAVVSKSPIKRRDIWSEISCDDQIVTELDKALELLEFLGIEVVS